MIDITDKSKCCGCSACVGICPKNCIEMKEDCEGFVYPLVIQDKCVQCGACDRVCPIQNVRPEIPFEQEGYIVQNKDKQILRESTAGGAFTAIAKYVISRGGIVFGVELSEQLISHHIYVETEKELFRFRNSKYVQSFVGRDTYRKVKFFLEQGKLVCFSGTPCQIEGVKNFLQKDYENLITVDVVCRAVPSPLIFRKYIELQEKKIGDDIQTVRFRDKYYGYKYSTMNIITKKNNVNYHKGVESDLWLRAFFSNICDRPSCHNCQFRKKYRVDDFTLWDCFNVGRFSKKLDNDRGATRMLVHTKKGKEIFRTISGDFCYVQIEPEKLIAGVNEMHESVETHIRRKEFFKDAEVMNGKELFEKYFPETTKVRLERIVRLVCYKIGIYSIAKKIFVRITHKY